MVSLTNISGCPCTQKVDSASTTGNIREDIWMNYFFYKMKTGFHFVVDLPAAEFEQRKQKIPWLIFGNWPSAVRRDQKFKCKKMEIVKEKRKLKWWQSEIEREKMGIDIVGYQTNGELYINVCEDLAKQLIFYDHLHLQTQNWKCQESGKLHHFPFIFILVPDLCLKTYLKHCSGKLEAGERSWDSFRGGEFKLGSFKQTFKEKCALLRSQPR